MAHTVDPIHILILVAANGYAADIQHFAVYVRDPDLMSYVVDCQMGRHDHTRLQAAAALGHIERVSVLCTAGAQLEATDTKSRYRTHSHCIVAHRRPDGLRTALHWASLRGHSGVVSLLILLGAKIDSLTLAGLTPLHEAACEGFAEVVRVLAENGANVNATTSTAMWFRLTPLTFVSAMIWARGLLTAINLNAQVYCCVTAPKRRSMPCSKDT